MPNISGFKIPVSVILLSLYLMTGYSQDIATDSKSSYIFWIPGTTIQPQFASNNIWINTPISHFWRKMYYVVTKDTGHVTSSDTIVYTVQESKVLFVKGNIVGNTRGQLVFNSQAKISPYLEAGFVKVFDSLFNPTIKTAFWHLSPPPTTGAFPYRPPNSGLQGPATNHPGTFS